MKSNNIIIKHIEDASIVDEKLEGGTKANIATTSIWIIYLITLKSE